MQPAEIYSFINANLACHLATLEENQPRVRGIMLYRANEGGLIFHTSNKKELYHQLIQHPQAEFCFNNFQQGLQVRVAGVLQEVLDLELKKEIVQNRDFLKPMVAAHGLEMLKVFCMKKGRATTWAMASNMAPKEWVEI